jgi:CheY-like chemotaxis protein
MEAPRLAPPRPRRILVVDDNRDAADSLRMLLQLDGHDVHVAYDGASALDQAARRRPQVVLLDIGMPGIDGREVARRIRAQAVGEPATLIALTGWGKAQDRGLSEAAGFDHHLVKPVELDTLYALLDGLDKPPGAG